MGHQETQRQFHQEGPLQRGFALNVEKPQAALLASSATPLPWREHALHSQTELLLCLPGAKTLLWPTEGPPGQPCPRGLSSPHARGQSPVPACGTASSAAGRCQVETVSCSGERLFWVVTASKGSRFIYLPSGLSVLC